MKKILYIIIPVLFAVSIMASCAPDDTTGGRGGKGGDQGYITFTIKSSSLGANVVSRATPTRAEVQGDDTYNENVLNEGDIHIFFYDNDTPSKPVIFYPLPDRFTIAESGSDTYEVRIKLEPEAGDTFSSFDPDDLIGHNVVLYVVANSGKTRVDFSSSPADETVANSPTSIMDTVLETDFNNMNGSSIVKQTSFVMDAYDEVYIAGWNDVASMELKRVAAKVEIGIYNTEVAGYTAASAQVMLVNYLEKSALGKAGTSETYTPVAGDYQSSSYIPLPELDSSDGTSATITYAEPLYSYPSEWASAPENAACLILEVMWYRNGESADTAVPYYYKIPVGNVTSGSIYPDRITRNNIYRYFANITSLGSTNIDDPEELDANVSIIDWTNQDVVADIEKFDWLLVDEKEIIIYPVPGQTTQEYLLHYKSNSDLTMAEISVTYENYSTGNMQTPIASGSAQYPVIDLNYAVGTEHYIRIQSATPINYVPKTINFKVENEALLFATVSVTHYPPVVVTSKITTTEPGSALFGEVGESPYMFIISTIALMGDETFTWSEATTGQYGISPAQTYNIGDTTTGVGGSTYVDNAQNAWVVSPKFVLQSGRGYNYNWFTGVTAQSLGDAKSRCNSDYSETATDGTSYPAGTWRLPTMAELYLIYKIQSDPNSAITNVLENIGPTRFWSAGNYLLTGGYESNGTQFNFGSGTDSHRGGGRVGLVHMAVCVNDIYE